MDADVALLQEAGQVPDHVAGKFSVGAREHWDSHVWNSGWHTGRWDRLFDRWPMVVKLSDRVEIEWFKQVGPISEPADDEIAVSGIGTIAAARVTPHDGEPFIAVSMYARWLKPHGSTNTKWRVGHSDGSAHRIITDLSAFIGHKDPGTRRILAAGDLNMIYGATEDNRLALPTRERTVFDRMASLGLEFLGLSTPTADRPTRHPKVCRKTPRTFPPITRLESHRNLLRISSTMRLPPTASTKRSQLEP